MKYYQLTIITEKVEETVTKLAEMDITSLQIEDPDDIKDIIENQSLYNWDFVDPDMVKDELSQVPRIKVFFETREQAEEIAGLLDASKMQDSGIKGITVEVIDDENWKNKYKEHFKALSLTEDIVVVPSWEEKPEGNVKVIDLDPGMAFGTGAHETTSMCARLMEKYGCEGKMILDVGTGSGILAIAAALMGSKDILGIDIDETAVEVARENVEKNRCSDVVEIKPGDLAKGIDCTADMVVANIIAELVIELAKDIKKHLKAGGSFICSGILLEKRDMVKNALTDLDFIIDDVYEKGDWCAIGAHYE